MESEIKKLFLPGDVVTIRQDIDNKPTMIVVRKETKTVLYKSISNLIFQGILCRWFTTNGQLQEAVFNTKDLIKIN